MPTPRESELEREILQLRENEAQLRLRHYNSKDKLRDELRREFRADADARVAKEKKDMIIQYDKMAASFKTLREHMNAFGRLSRAYNKAIGKWHRSKATGRDKRAAQLEECRQEIEEAMVEEQKAAQEIIGRLKGDLKDHNDRAMAAQLDRQMALS